MTTKRILYGKYSVHALLNHGVTVSVVLLLRKYERKLMKDTEMANATKGPTAYISGQQT